MAIVLPHQKKSHPAASGYKNKLPVSEKLSYGYPPGKNYQETFFYPGKMVD
jgi:hypothetical protein